VFSKQILNLLLVIFFTFMFCSDRERLNPLDPSNPYSEGAPTGVRIYSKQDQAILHWSPMQVTDLEIYYIYRSFNEENLAKYDSISGSFTKFVDNKLKYDKQYSYAVQAVTAHSKSRLSDTLSIVPGEYELILADYWNQSLSRITYDASRLFKFYDGFTPTDMVIFQDRIYFTNLWDNSVKILDQKNEILSVALDESPVDLALDSINRILYVLTRDNNRLFRISINGENFGSENLGIEINFNSTISYDPVLECLWITDDSFDKIYRYNLSGHFIVEISDDIDSPDEIIVDEISGGCWIASRSGIVHIQADGEIIKHLTEYSVYDLSLDKRTGDLYYSALKLSNNSWEIGYLHNDVHTTLYNSYSFIYKIKTIQETIGTGLALIDGNKAEIIRINAFGVEIGRRSGAYGVVAVGLQ
jgi:hypothetical protein